MKPSATFCFIAGVSFLSSFVSTEIDINDVSAKLDVVEGKVGQQGIHNFSVERGTTFTLRCFNDHELPYNFTLDFISPNNNALQEGRYKSINESDVLNISNEMEKARELKIYEASADDTGMYECKMTLTVNNTHTIEKVTSLHVNVIGKPEAVQNFTCISKNLEVLTCNWSIKQNLKTTYKIYFNLPGRARRKFNATCPNDSDINNNTCTWAYDTIPVYRRPYEFYYFVFTGVNELGSVEFPPITFHHFAHVVPEMPGNLQAQNITTDSANLSWRVPNFFHYFHPGLLHRVEVQSEREPDNWEIATSSLFTKNVENVSYHLTGLKFANTLYTIKVLLKSKIAVSDEFWSAPSYITFRTAAATRIEPQQ